VLLTWQAPTNTGGSPIVAYKIYRGGSGRESYLTTTSNTSYTDGTGGRFTWNYYKVTAVNAAGFESPLSSEVGGYKSC
jgi:fibronectin type 3 domain-containing protein